MPLTSGRPDLKSGLGWWLAASTSITPSKAAVTRKHRAPGLPHRHGGVMLRLVLAFSASVAGGPGGRREPAAGRRSGWQGPCATSSQSRRPTPPVPASKDRDTRGHSGSYHLEMKRAAAKCAGRVGFSPQSLKFELAHELQGQQIDSKTDSSQCLNTRHHR